MLGLGSWVSLWPKGISNCKVSDLNQARDLCLLSSLTHVSFPVKPPDEPYQMKTNIPKNNFRKKNKIIIIKIGSL